MTMQGEPAAIFRQEAAELLETLEQALLDLNVRRDDADIVGTIFRALHTIKGSGAMFGFARVAAFVHEFETAFDRVRNGKARVTPDLVTVALEATDHVRGLIEGGEAGVEAGADDALLARLGAALGGEDIARGAAPVAAAAREAAPPPAAEGWLIRFRPPEDMLRNGGDPRLLLDELAGLGPCRVTAELGAVPPLDMLEALVCSIGWRVELAAPVPREAVEDVFLFIRDEMDLEITPLAPPAAEPAQDADTPSGATHDATHGATPGEAPAPASAGEAAPRARPAEKSQIRVPAERLDSLMNQVGELVTAEARLRQHVERLRDQGLVAVAEEIERLVAGLRDTTMGIRMMPIGTLTGRLRRLVHDLSRELGKPMGFVALGEETELDKTVLEQIADPLVHLIRNAADHGIEAPGARAAAGKPPEGTIRVAARHVGAEVVITVADDGAGLDAARIRAKAVAAGLIAADAAMPVADIHRLIFHPGLSTARQITSVSGRGVGMDVVKRTIEHLRGTIDLGSELGAGTTVTLRLPLTLAIIEGLLVRVGASRFTIPLAAVEECVELPPAGTGASMAHSFISLRGQLIPLISLRASFATREPPDAFQKVVIVSSGDLRVGLVVDQIIGDHQTVIKQLSPLHSGIRTFSGASILGDGTVALILDVMHLVGAGQAIEAARRGEMAGRAA